MYTDCYAHPAFARRLTELEDELDLPIRYLAWNTRRADGIGWRGMNERAGVSVYEATERGITIWDRNRRDPGFQWRDMTLDGLAFYECITYPSEPIAPIEFDGQIVGEIVQERPREIGLVVSLTDSANTIPDGLIEAVVEAVRGCIDPAFLEGLEERREQRQRELFENYVRNSYDSRFQNYRASIDNQLIAVTNWQEAIVTAMREVNRQQEMLDAMILVRENDAGDEFMQQWEQLQAHPRVADIRFSGNNAIEITTTDDLRLYHPTSGDSRHLGAFRITMTLDNMQIRLNNLSTVRGGRDHPHVSAGRACFGGHQQSFNELLINGQILVLFELLIQYLETLNLADEYGRYGSYWFDAPDERPLEVAEAELVTA